MRAKYGNVKVKLDGYTFDSKHECERYKALKLAERTGEIRDLKMQPKFYFEHNGVKMGYYAADFSYLEKEGSLVIEDVKGVKTAVYQLKKKMMLAFHGIKIVEITKK